MFLLLTLNTEMLAGKLAIAYICGNANILAETPYYLYVCNIPASSFSHCVKSVPIPSFFLVRIFPYSDKIRRFTPQIPVFSANTGKYGTEKTSYLDIFPCNASL